MTNPDADDARETANDVDDDREARTGPSNDEKQMAMFCHIGALIGGIILPLVLWLTQKEKSAFVDDQGKEVVNFQITVLCFGLITCCFGFVIAWPFSLVFHILGGMAASRGERYRYPVCIRFIK
jgi:uncharacterized protein